MDNRQNDLGSGEPSQPERTAEQLKAIHDAMMEELGIGRMDTLPLEDRGYRGFIPLARPVPSQVPTNAAVAAWHNMEFNDVDEAHDQLDNIAGGQLYRLRRNAPGAPSQTPTSRGGHHSFENIVRGGRGDRGSRVGNTSTGGPARRSSARGARGGLSGSTRGGRGSSSVVGPHAMTPSNKSSTYYNDGRRGENNDPRSQAALTMLREAAAPASQENRPPASYHLNRLADPQAFFNHVGMNARAESVPTPAKQTQPSHGPVAAPRTSQSTFSAVGRSTQVLTSLPSHQAPSVVGEDPALTRAPTPAIARVSNGITSSRWASPPVATSPSRHSFSATSFITSEASVASIPTLAASTHAAPMSNLSPVSNHSSLTSSIPHVASLVVSTTSPSVSKSAVNTPAIMNQSTGSAVATGTSNSRVYGSEASRNSNASQISLTGRLVLMEKPATATRNGGHEIQGKARLIKMLDSVVLEHVVPTANTSVAKAPAVALKAPNQMIDPSTPVIETSTQVQVPAAALHISETVRNSPRPVVDTSTSAGSRSISNITEGMGESSAAVFDPYDLDTLPVSRASDNEIYSTTLIDFSQEVPREVCSPPEPGSALDDLVCMNNDFMVAALLEMLNKAVGGPFFKSTHDLPAEESLSLIEDLTMAWMKLTPSFRKFPKDLTLAYIKGVSKQAFDSARAVDRDLQIYENDSTLKDDDVTSKLNSLCLGGEASVPGNNYPQQVEKSQPVVKPQDVNETQPEDGRLKVYKYSIQELVGMRDPPLTLNRKLPQLYLRNIPPRQDSPGSRAYMANKLRQKARSSTESTHELKQPVPRLSIDDFAPKFTNPEYQTLLDGQGSSGLKPAISNVAAGSSTPQKPQLLQEFSPETDISGNSNHSQSDPALYGSIITAMRQNELSKLQPKGLNITAPTQPAAVTSSSSDRGGRQAQQSQPSPRSPRSTNQVGLTAAAPLFTPSHKASPEAPRDNQEGSTLLQKKILETSNKREDMERAKLPGLATSRWSTAQSLVPRAVSSFSTPPQQYAPSPTPDVVPSGFPQQYTSPSIPFAMPSAPPQPFASVVCTILIPDVNNPGSMQAITGLEVVGQIPIVAHQPRSPPTMYEENSGFQCFPQPLNVCPPLQEPRRLPNFPPRPTTFTHHTHNTSSTTSDNIFDKRPPVSPVDTIRPPLSPRKANIQANFKESIHRGLPDRRN